MLSERQRGSIVGVLLAGGLSRRMGGGAKALLPLAGKPMIAHVIETLSPQAGTTIINVNERAEDFAQFGLPLTADRDDSRGGPLAGVLAGMDWAHRHAPPARWILTAPCDTPFIPDDYAERLFRAAASVEAPIAIAASDAQEHYACGLFSISLADDLARSLGEGEHRVRIWIARHGAVTAPFPLEKHGCDPFFNVNTPEDLAVAADRLKEPKP